MEPVDRSVRAAVFRLFVAGIASPSVDDVARELGADVAAVNVSFGRLAAQHRLVLTEDTGRVLMAHPFSGAPTDYQATIGSRTWWANLSMLGHGDVTARAGDDTLRWTVREGTVAPQGLVHFVVPPARFWDDIVFT